MQILNQLPYRPGVAALQQPSDGRDPVERLPGRAENDVSVQVRVVHREGADGRAEPRDDFIERQVG